MSFSIEVPQTYTFSLCIDRGDRTLVDITVEVEATAEEIAKAKRTIQRLMDEYALDAKTSAPTPEPDPIDPIDLPPELEATEEEPPADIIPAPAPAVIRKQSAFREKGAKGLMLLYCKSCGDIFSTFLKDPRQEFTCKCGSRIDLTGPMVRFQYICPCCEKRTYGKTNVEEPSFEAWCLCGNRVMLTWVPKEKEYRT